jgi:hypothetical protein
MTIQLGLRTLALIAFVGAASAILLGAVPGVGSKAADPAHAWALHALLAMHH